ncbi:MAG: HNH endonuclease [Mycoplasmoidaceae bacterium]
MSLINNTMVITPKKLKIKDLVVGYDWDTKSDGKDVMGFGGKLRIQPKFQRNFLYEIGEQEKLIISILRKFPINTIYFYQPDKNKEYYELLDGQQRVVSICNFFVDGLAVNLGGEGKDRVPRPYRHIPNDLKEVFLNYELDVYVCNGSVDDRVDWFKTINIGNKPLVEQEILNSNISPSNWLEDAKSYFSSSTGGGYLIGRDYISGNVKRQKYLEDALKWYVAYGKEKNNNAKKYKDIQEYMYEKKDENNCLELKEFFQKVIEWIEKTFPVDIHIKKKDSVDWGKLYSKYWAKDIKYSRKEMIEKLNEFSKNNDIDIKGAFEYFFTNDEHYLQKRFFSDEDKKDKFDKQKGACAICGKKFENINDLQGDHIKPITKGGKTEFDNLQMLCKTCNTRKGNKYIE